jgi:DNA uptake protein ComE-like DNA-binding protein
MLSLLLVLACGNDVSIRNDTSYQSLQDSMGLSDAQVSRILAFVRACTTTEALLDGEVGLDSDAAGAIVNVRDGADGDCDTADDAPFDTLEDLDDVPQVGEQTLRALQAYLDGDADTGNGGGGNGGTWEGVTFTAAEAGAVLEIANQASSGVLDNDVGLASDETTEIVDARPLADMDALAAVPQVGASALRKLQDYVPRWGG